MSEIELDEDFWNYTKLIEEYALEVAKNISYHNNEKTNWNLINKSITRLDVVINSTQKYYYLASDHREYSFLYFVTDCFISLLRSHLAFNGNERFTTMFLKNILYSEGFYLKWTSNNLNNSKEYKWNIEEKIAEFCKNLHNHNEQLSDEKFKQKRQEIYNWLIEHIVIGLNFRQ